MKKMLGIILLSLLLAIAASSVYARERANIYLIDVSSSVSDCEDIMVKNMKALRQDIEGIDKNDRVIAFAFGYKGKPALIVNETMPPKRGGGGRLIAQKKSEVLKAISGFLKDFKKTLDDTATDIVGAIKECAIIRSDLKDNYDVRLLVFSDGQQTVGLDVHSIKDMTTISEYISSLQKYLQGKKMDGIRGVDVIFYGDSCSIKNITHGDFANLQGGIKQVWKGYFSEQGVNSIDYRLLYK